MTRALVLPLLARFLHIEGSNSAGFIRILLKNGRPGTTTIIHSDGTTETKPYDDPEGDDN
jgi:hypothetical protein